MILKNKNLIRLILFIMGISLVGIIWVQLVWMINAIDIKDQQFMHSVNEALTSLSNKLENRQAKTFVTSRINAVITDSTGNIYVNDNSSTIDVEVTDSACEIMVVASRSINAGEITENSTIIKSCNQNNNLTFNDESNDSVQIIIAGMEDRLSAKATKLHHIIEQITLEYDTIAPSIEERLNLDSFDSLLTSELISKGINLDNEHGITDNSDSSTAWVHASKSFDKNNELAWYSVPLFTNDLVDKSINLHVSFPDKNSHLIKSMSVLLVVSALFTFFIILTFAFTIIVILRQKKVSEIKTEFINNMTHEFKTPIATISLAVDSIDSKPVLSVPEKIQYFTNIIRKENNRMNSQVERVLQMSLIDKKDFNLNLQITDIHSLINRAIANISLQVEKKQGKIIASLVAEKFEIVTDEIHFMNIIYNLLDNANKYSDGSPEIIVETLNINNQLCIKVIDKGIGMSNDEKAKVFDKFYRVATGNVHNVKGFGLGLSYVKAIVLAHNGRINIESEPGKGSTFEICIPTKQD